MRRAEALPAADTWPAPAGLRRARWQARRAQLRTTGTLRAWLGAAGSLTARLVAHSTQFRVRRLHQQIRPCLRDEAGALGLARAQQVWEREVLLVCDGRPVVFAHTVVPLSASASDWPLFGSLGERSLGSTLFGDPRVRRGALEFARLAPAHPLARRARAALGGSETGVLWARRCLYRRRRGWLLVTEVFLPGIEMLAKPQHNMNK